MGGGGPGMAPSGADMKVFEFDGTAYFVKDADSNSILCSFQDSGRTMSGKKK